MSLALSNGKEAISTATPVTADSSGTLPLVTRTVWQTITNTSFVVGAVVGATLMYASLRVAQHYLSSEGEPDRDRPF